MVRRNSDTETKDALDTPRDTRTYGTPTRSSTLVTEREAERREEVAARHGAKHQADADRVEAAPEPQRWTHVSFMASLSLIVGTLAVAATLTGLLAPIGFAAGILTIILAVLARVGRSHVTGHSLVGLSVVFGIVAIVLSVLAINGQLSWLSSDADIVATVHTWLNDHISWLRKY